MLQEEPFRDPKSTTHVLRIQALDSNAKNWYLKLLNKMCMSIREGS